MHGMSDGLDPIDTDLDAFRDAVLGALVAGDDADLRRAGQAVMAPVFVEKMIEEILPGGAWNGVLFLMARRLIEASPELGYLIPSLDAKRALVGNPDAVVTDLLEVGRTDQGLTIRLR